MCAARVSEKNNLIFFYCKMYFCTPLLPSPKHNVEFWENNHSITIKLICMTGTFNVVSDHYSGRGRGDILMYVIDTLLLFEINLNV